MAFIGEKIKDISLIDSTRKSFLNYGMSVITDRALPDVRDGLKPVQRRILFAMHDLGMFSNKPYKKSARVVGEVIGKYHPHGDSAVYEAMVRMTQDFKLRYPLVDGHGYFGSLDGDGAAAMRYTEARMSKLSMELLRGIKFQTVDYIPNFDTSEQEPVVLPARFPNLLVNGVNGIAVSMATNCAPHNLNEVISAIYATIDNPSITTEELMTHIKGPDFPTGATIYGAQGIKKAYLTGRGGFVVRGTAKIVKNRDGSQEIIITELPYQVNKQALVKRLWDMQETYNQNKDNPNRPKHALDFVKPDGIQDSSDEHKVEIVIKLKKQIDNPEVILNSLYQYTDLQVMYHINNVVLVPVKLPNGTTKVTPKQLSLKEMIKEYIKHQYEVVVRHIQYDLAKTESRRHMLEGIMKALDRLDETIKVIRNSKSRKEAVERLMELLNIDEEQAGGKNGILDRKIQTLANFEHEELRADFEEMNQDIALFQKKLSDDTLIYNDIKQDLEAIRSEFGDERRTRIVEEYIQTNTLDLIPDEDVVITLTKNGFIKSTLESSYKTHARNRRGANGITMYEGDHINYFHIAKAHDMLLFFTNTGRVYPKYAYEIPKGLQNSKGQSMKLFLQLAEHEHIQNVVSVRDFDTKEFVFFVTKQGTVKRSSLLYFRNIRKNGLNAISLNEGDELVSVLLTKEQDHITLVSQKGKSITFESTAIRSKSRKAQGVRGMSLANGDTVVAAASQEEYADLLIVTNEGYVKRTPLSEYTLQKRGGKGILTMKLTEKNGRVIDALVVKEDNKLMSITNNGTVLKVKVSDIPQIGRNTQGVRLMNLREEDEVMQVARILEEEEEE